MASAEHFSEALNRHTGILKALEPFEWEPWTATRGSPIDRWMLSGEKLRRTAQAKQVSARSGHTSQEQHHKAEPEWEEYNTRERQTRLAKLEEYEREALE